MSTWPSFTRDSKSAEFFDAAARGELFVRSHCSQAFAPETLTCPVCGDTDLVWTKAAGTGTVVTWTVVHRPPNRAFADLVPYTLAVVELTEGPWLYTRIEGDPPIRAGEPVHVSFVPGEAENYPVFTTDPAFTITRGALS